MARGGIDGRRFSGYTSETGREAGLKSARLKKERKGNMPEVNMTPTVGRKVWFWASDESLDDMSAEPLDNKQPFDATVVYVHSNGLVNLQVTTHSGDTGIIEGCPLRQPTGEEEHGGEADYCTWMPYQVGQARQQALAGAMKDAGNEEKNK